MKAVFFMIAFCVFFTGCSTTHNEARFDNQAGYIIEIAISPGNLLVDLTQPPYILPEKIRNDGLEVERYKHRYFFRLKPGIDPKQYARNLEKEFPELQAIEIPTCSFYVEPGTDPYQRALELEKEFGTVPKIKKRIPGDNPKEGYERLEALDAQKKFLENGAEVRLETKTEKQ